MNTYKITYRTISNITVNVMYKGNNEEEAIAAFCKDYFKIISVSANEVVENEPMEIVSVAKCD